MDVGESEQADQSVEHGVDDDVEVIRSPQPGRQFGHRPQLAPVPVCRSGVGVEQAEVVRALDGHDAEDRRGPEAEDVLHVRVGRDRVDVVAQALEHGTSTLGAFVTQPKAVLGHGGRVEEQQVGGGVGREVA